MCLCPDLVDLGIGPNPQLPLLCNKQLDCNTKIAIQSCSLLGSSRLEKSDFQTLVNAKLESVLAGKEFCTFHAFSRLSSVSRKQLARMIDFESLKPNSAIHKKAEKGRSRESRELQNTVFTKN